MSSVEVKLPVEHVSDTAYMVALYRAQESERPDAKFKDPLARMLASPKAEELEKLVPFREEGLWFMSVRTSLLDKQIENIVAGGVDTVLNLAAGLDTRPYRLKVPSSTRWLEADLPGIIKYKEEKLQHERPVCRLERIALDLTDDKARADLFNKAFGESKRALVVTEGILPYLPEETIRKMALELRQEKALSYWLMEIATAGFLSWFRSHIKTDASASKVSLRFAPENGAYYFADLGWRVEALDSFLEGGEKLNRKPPVAFLIDPGASLAANESGIAVLIKS